MTAEEKLRERVLRDMISAADGRVYSASNYALKERAMDEAFMLREQLRKQFGKGATNYMG